MGWLKIQRLECLEKGQIFFMKQKNSLPVPLMTHIEKLLFFSSCNLQGNNNSRRIRTSVTLSSCSVLGV